MGLRFLRRNRWVPLHSLSQLIHFTKVSSCGLWYGLPHMYEGEVWRNLRVLEILFKFFLFCFLFLYFLFIWRLITLQYCTGLPYIDMNPPGVYMCSPSWTPLPPPSLSHPSGSSQCTSPKHPVSCTEPGLAMCFIYDNIHVSMLFSQIIPPSPPTESKRLFYTSVSLLLSRTKGYHYHLSKFHIYVLVYCIGVFLSDLLHSVCCC